MEDPVISVQTVCEVFGRSELNGGSQDLTDNLATRNDPVMPRKGLMMVVCQASALPQNVAWGIQINLEQ